MILIPSPLRLKIWGLHGQVIVNCNNAAENDESIFPQLSRALGQSRKMATLMSLSEKDAGKIRQEMLRAHGALFLA